MKFRILIATVFAFNFSFGQAEDCECVTRSPIFYKDNFHLILSVEQARINKVDSILIFLVNSPGSTQLHKSFELDPEGQLSSITNYHQGHPSSRIFYVREWGRITREEFVYLNDDGLEERFGKKVTDYYYNQKGLLVKTQERGIREEILPQDETHYTLYEYDSLGRLQYKKFHMQWGPQGPGMRSVNETRYTYSSDGSFKETTNFNSESSLTAKHILTPEGFPHNIIYPGAEELFNYSDKRRIISYQLKNTSTFADECPENSNYKDSIEYDEQGFIKTIRHEYSDKVCSLMLEYKKASNSR